MNPNKTIEYNSLSWVKAQLDDVLSDAQSNLNDYIENKKEEDLENCIEHLQLIYGTLQMVEVYGASMLAEEMQYTTTALLEGKVESAYDAYDVLMRAMLQLPDYLESIQAGKMDAPISLMPLINDLRAARNEGLLTEGSLFSPDIENAELGSGDYDAANIEAGKLQDEVKRLRTHYQLGLLDFIRNNKETAGLKRIKAVLNSLEKVTRDAEVRHMWIIISALVDGLMDKGIENNLTVKKLLGAVDRQLKLVLDLGEAEFANNYSKELVTNVLYYVGLSTVENASVTAVKDAYKLGDLLPQNMDDSDVPAVGGLNADLFDTVSKGITEDLGQVKDVLELYMHSNDKNIEQLAPVSEQLGKIGDTYGMLGMGAIRQSIMDQRVILDKIISGEIEINEQVVLGFASELLNAESELKNFIADRSGFVDMNRSTEDQAVPAAEYRQVVFTVVSEALNNFSEAKEAVLSYAAGSGDKSQLELILNRLEEVRGVAMMLPLGRIETQIEKLQNFISIALLNNDHKVSDQEQDTVADVVTSIEYFLEALSEGRPGVEQGLDAGDAAAEKLDVITKSYPGGDVVGEPADIAVEVDESSELELVSVDDDQDSDQTRGNVVDVSDELTIGSDEAAEADLEDDVDDDIIPVAELPVEAPEESQTGAIESSVSEMEDPESTVPQSTALESTALESTAPGLTAVDATQYTILADDADEEIVEIFIEEAVEVLGELHDNLPQWKADPGDNEALAVVRRCFHTLKGSGRLLGAEMIGEFSWKFENMLNRIIDEKINISDDLFQALEEALAVIPQLIEQLKGNREPIDNIGQLMAAADALAEGHDFSFEAGSDAASDSVAEDELAHDEVAAGATEEDTATVTGSELHDSPVVEESAVILDFSENLQAASEVAASEVTTSEDAVGEEAATRDAEDSDLESIEPGDSDKDVSVDDLSIDGMPVDNVSVDDSSTSASEVDDGADNIEIVNFDDIREDLSISDSSDLDISELDPENNISYDAIERSSVEVESVEEEQALHGKTSEPGDDEFSDTLPDDEIISIENELEDITSTEDDFDGEFDILELTENAAEPAAAVENEQQSDEPLEISAESDVTIEIGIEQGDKAVRSTTNSIDMDPMLLKIYYDESVAHVENVREYFSRCETENLPVTADKDLVRAFHTLYGSARTAEVDSIADLAGTAEKYLKSRQDSGVTEIPDEVVVVLQDIEKSVSTMLSEVAEGYLPAADKELHDKMTKIFQQEIQSQLQKSWRDTSSVDEVAMDETISIATDDEFDEEFIDVAELNDSGITVDDEEFTDVAELNANDTAGDDEGFDDLEELNDSSTTGDNEEIISEEIVATAEEEPPVEASASTAVPDEVTELSYGDIDDDLIDIFLEEAEELLESCEQVLADLRAEPNSTEHVHKLQRNMHTLKGGARMADLTPVGDLTHNLESLVAMVNEKKVYVDKEWFNLLQESLDTLTTMLGAVKKRKPVISVGDLNERVEMMMRGEVKDKRAVERFDIELTELESTDIDDDIEEIDIANLLLQKKIESSQLLDGQRTGQLQNDQRLDTQRHDDQQQPAAVKQRRGDDKHEDRPHWGERASDVNFKDSHEQVRVRSDLLNNLVNYAGEVNIYHARMGKQVLDFGFNLSELSQTVVRLKEQLRNLEIETEIQIRSGYEKENKDFDDDFDPLEMDQYSTLQQLTRSLSETAGDVDSIKDILNEITRDAETLLVQESRVSTDLQEGLMRTRMVRFGGLSSRLRRIVRQVSRELGKEVEVKIEGESSEVDRTVLDRIIAPLEHMLRNAVAHGIESPSERKVLGKNETGTISIDVNRQGTDVVIKIVDDGAGIDAHKIKEKAIKQGLLPPGTEISDHDALQFILHSGFSTADEVTQVSGRGVGMDVVDSEIKQLGGVLEINTVRGKSTTFRIRLPLTLAINQALLVSAADDVFAVPLASIEGVVRITGLELQQFYDSENSYYEFNGVEYELKHLGGLLTGHQPDYSKQLQLFPVLLVHVGDQHFALHVEDMLGRREIVVKPVGLQIGSVHGIAGATILADGRVVLILEMSALVVAESLFKSHVPIADEQPVVSSDEVKTIMVVDDSITIRKITERILKRYGINVLLAKDGVDATNQLQEQIPDLILLDIEMPRMDGFEVASYIRNDDRLKDIPIIMITSRTGSKHKDKAMEIGVDKYLGKPFQEEDLMNNINDILKTTL